MIVLNHELELIYAEKKLWNHEKNKISIDGNKVYEYIFSKNQLFEMDINNQFEKNLLRRNLKGLFLTIQNNKIFTMQNGSLKQQLLK